MLPEDERISYDKHLEDLRYSASMTWTMKVDEEDRVREDERKREKIQLDLGMKKKEWMAF